MTVATRSGVPKQRLFRSRHARGTVICGDALIITKKMPSNSTRLLFLDPPFNLGKKYGANSYMEDNLTDDQYEGWMKALLRECVRVLSPGGTLFLYHLPKWAMSFGSFLSDHLEFRHWIAVSMKNGFVRGKRLYPAHYALLMFSLDAPAVFNRPKLPVEKCRHCGGNIRDYGGYSSIIEEKGINLSDIWTDFSPVRHAKYKNRKQNELPLGLFERIIEMSGCPGDLYYDPFAGTGTGVIAASRAGMRFKAVDIHQSNYDLICTRIEEHCIRSRQFTGGKR